MNDVSLVQVGQGQGDFGHVELGHRLLEETVNAQQRFQIATYQILHDLKVTTKYNVNKKVQLKSF